VPEDSSVPKNAVRAIVVILTAMALLAIFAHVQHLRRDKLETVIVTPVATPSAWPASP
jgi:hypothetical protein